jgi:hypothetical protein
VLGIVIHSIIMMTDDVDDDLIFFTRSSSYVRQPSGQLLNLEDKSRVGNGFQRKKNFRVRDGIYRRVISSSRLTAVSSSTKGKGTAASGSGV